MQGYFWNTVLAINSVLWFLGIVFLSYSTGMLVFRGQWRQFLFALAAFIIISLIELVLTGLAHGPFFLLRAQRPQPKRPIEEPRTSR